MSETIYLDLPEFGLRFVGFEDPRFPALLNEIVEQPQPFPVPDMSDLSHAALLLNESGKAIIVLNILWRFKEADGRSRTSLLGSLGSSTQMDILWGRAQADHDLSMSILAGSKRLVTERVCSEAIRTCCRQLEAEYAEAVDLASTGPMGDIR